jgi:phospho-N-acetylmuramoyl-pentapeptide-transferase
MGGVGLLIPVVVGAMGFGVLNSSSGRLFLAVVMACAALGLVDDVLKLRGINARGLRSAPKFWATVVVGLALGGAVAAYLPERMFFETPWGVVHLGLPLWLMLSVAVLCATTHAVNLTDGMDGLAIGTAAIVLVFLGFWLALRPEPDTALLVGCSLLAGACVGFLWFNRFPAAVFMGDAGALGIGGAIAALCLLSGWVFWLLILGSVFVVEALSVIVQVTSYKWRQGRRVFRVAPIHHHFHLGGLQETVIVQRFWIAAVFSGLVATLWRF